MNWPKTINGHSLMVIEASKSSILGLSVYCYTCALDLGFLDQICFPKYRIAFGSAWKRADTHATHGRWDSYLASHEEV